MNSAAVFSIILHDRYPAQRWARFFLSLARQDLPLRRVELCLVREHPESTRPCLPRFLRIWGLNSTGLQIRRCSTAMASSRRGMHGIQAESRGLLTLFAHPGTRLDAQFISRHLAVHKAFPKADMLYADFLHLGQAGSAWVRNRGSIPRLLQQIDALGPLPVFTRKAVRLCRRSPHSPFPTWEQGIQAVQRGLRFHRIPGPLYSVEADAWQPGGHVEKLARLVTRQPGFFHMAQLRWALGVLRRSGWALNHQSRTIPQASQVPLLLERFVREQQEIYAGDPEQNIPELAVQGA